MDDDSYGDTVLVQHSAYQSPVSRGSQTADSPRFKEVVCTVKTREIHYLRQPLISRF